MLKVMIVDDLEVIRRQMKRLPLWGEESGFVIVDEASDGKEALEKLHHQPVDLLITDIRMPRIDGIELLKEVQQQKLASCVVFLSEHSEFAFAKEAIQFGIFDYLVKPVKKDELQQLLEKVKANISVREEAQERLRKLESTVLEKIDVYYPSEQIQNIFDKIIASDRTVAEDIDSLIKATTAALENEDTKVMIVLQKSYRDIIMRVYEAFPWFLQMVMQKQQADLAQLQGKVVPAMQALFQQNVQELMAIKNRFVFVSKKHAVIKEVCLYVIRNYQNINGLDNIADAFFLTKKHLGELFKQETGMTLGEYITMVKLERAKVLIRDGMLKHYEIAQAVGYHNTEYFAKVFKKHVGKSPMEFKHHN